MNNRKLGSIALARSLCYQINGAADDSDDIDGGGYGSVDVAEILSAEVVRLQKALAQPEQEPVAWNAGVAPMWPQQKEGETFSVSYTTTPQQQPVFDCPRCGHVCSQRPWQGLTDDEREDIALEVPIEAALMTEARLKEVNK